MEKEILIDQIEKLTGQYNIQGLDNFINELSPEDIKIYKTEIADGYLSIFSYIYHDWVCDKFIDYDKEDIILELLDLLSSAEEINPEEIHYRRRSSCYEFFAELKTEIVDKLIYLQKAIDVYVDAIKVTGNVEYNANIASLLLEKMSITQQFTKNDFLEILHMFKLAYTEYSEMVFNIFLYSCFKILEFPFEKNKEWYLMFLGEFNLLSTNFAEKNQIIYLTWSHELMRVLRNNDGGILPEYTSELYDYSASLLKHLQEFETEDTEILNKLGHAFEDAATNITLTENKILLFKWALKNYKKGQSINPYAWTFPVYATNVLKKLAGIYYIKKNKKKVIEIFEEGKHIFSQFKISENDITLTLNWGRFLIEYAKLAYDFKAKDILLEAEEILLIAKDLGKNYYSQPFILLAKVALKTGDAEKAITILKDCENIFTTKYSTYSFSEVLEDEDFSEIHQNEMFKHLE